jgi:hypothetical protein
VSRLGTPPNTILVRLPTGDVPPKGERKIWQNFNLAFDEIVMLTVKIDF